MIKYYNNCCFVVVESCFILSFSNFFFFVCYLLLNYFCFLICCWVISFFAVKFVVVLFFNFFIFEEFLTGRRVPKFLSQNQNDRKLNLFLRGRFGSPHRFRHRCFKRSRCGKESLNRRLVFSFPLKRNKTEHFIILEDSFTNS